MTIRIWRVPLLAGAMLSMIWGVWLGLLRLGWSLPLPWPDQLILHGPLMIGGFVGTLIGLERAIGLAKRWAYAAPILSAAGALLLVFGPPGPLGPLLITTASAIVVSIFLVVARRQPAMFVWTMTAGAVCWLIGNILWCDGAAIFRVVFWWVAFLVLTIAGERLELNRLLRPTSTSRALFVAASAILLAGTAAFSGAPQFGARVIGIGLFASAAWLWRNDIARRTIRQHGLTRYMASCLLAGYVWLGFAGLLLFVTTATTPGPVHDGVLHAIFIGFVVSMIFGHAPIVFPAVSGVPIRYRPIFYLHLAALHASVAVRIVGDLSDEFGRLRAWGALGNASAVLLFVGATALSVGATKPIDRRPL